MAAKLQHSETTMTKFDQPGFEAGRLAAPVRLIADEFAQNLSIRTESDQIQPSVAETIDYIQTFTQELRQMAQQAGLSRLALILTLAEQEADQELRRDR